MCNWADSTFCPVPIRRRPLVTALVHERVFKELDVISVEWEKQSRIVDLLPGLKMVEEQRIQRTYLGIKVHMHIDEV